MRTGLIAVVLFACVASNAYAQTTPERRWTFGVTGGWGKTWEDEGGIGTGVLIGGYLDRRLSKHVDAEISVDVLKNKRTDAFRADGHTTYFSAQLVGRIGTRTANLFVTGGGTLGVYRGTTGFLDGSFHSRHSSTNPGFIFGGGLSFRTANDVEIAPIVRMTLMRVESGSDPWASITGGFRLGFGR